MENNIDNVKQFLELQGLTYWHITPKNTTQRIFAQDKDEITLQQSIDYFEKCYELLPTGDYKIQGKTTFKANENSYRHFPFSVVKGNPNQQAQIGTIYTPPPPQDDSRYYEAKLDLMKRDFDNKILLMEMKRQHEKEIEQLKKKNQSPIQDAIGSLMQNPDFVKNVLPIVAPAIQGIIAKIGGVPTEPTIENNEQGKIEIPINPNIENEEESQDESEAEASTELIESMQEAINEIKKQTSSDEEFIKVFKNLSKKLASNDTTAMMIIKSLKNG